MANEGAKKTKGIKMMTQKIKLLDYTQRGRENKAKYININESFKTSKTPELTAKNRLV